MADLHVYVGIDAGTKTSKLAYSDNISTRIIASPEGFDINALREEAEIFFDEPVFSCVIAIPENFSRRQREDILFSAKSNGSLKQRLLRVMRQCVLQSPKTKIFWCVIWAQLKLSSLF